MVDFSKLHGIGAGGGKAIKSLQHFYVDMGAGSYIEVPINAVNPDNTIIRIEPFYVNPRYPQYTFYNSEFNGNDSVRLQRWTGSSTWGSNVYTVDVIEFENVNSIQRGTISRSNGESVMDAIVTPVDLTKTIVFWDYRMAGTTGDWDVNLVGGGRWLDNSTCRFQFKGSDNAIVSYQIIEFE